MSGQFLLFGEQCLRATVAYEYGAGVELSEGGSMARALLIVDIQQDYFPGGAFPLVAPEAAAKVARRVLDAYRGQGATVIHIQHVWDEPDATYMRPGTAGVEIHPAVAPSGDEIVLAKSEPNSFTGTGLEAEFHSRGIDQVTVVGMMTSMCVDSTVRAGAELGFQMSVVHDACAASDLEFGDTSVPGSQVQAAFMAALSDGIAAVVSGDDAVNEITGANH